jgi:hypothetical protein
MAHLPLLVMEVLVLHQALQDHLSPVVVAEVVVFIAPAEQLEPAAQVVVVMAERKTLMEMLELLTQVVAVVVHPLQEALLQAATAAPAS